jgi:YVTN family beta-propeller protein
LKGRTAAAVAAFAFASVIPIANCKSQIANPLFVSNERSGTVTVIDSSTNQPVTTIKVGKRPRGIRLSPDGKTLYVALSGSPIVPPSQREEDAPPADKTADGIGVVDVASHTLARILPSGSDPEQFDLTPDGKKMYIANEDEGAVTLLDLSSGKRLKQLKVGTEPEGVTTSPDGQFVYVTSESTNDVHVIDTARDEIVAHLKTPQRPRAVAFTPDGTKAYVTCESGGVVGVIDTASHKLTKQIKPADARIEGARPMGIAMAPDGKRVYVTTGRGKAVIAIDTASDTIVAVAPDVAPRPWGVGVTPDGKLLYTANGPSNDVAVLDAATMKLITRIPAGESPWGIAIAKPQQ